MFLSVAPALDTHLRYQLQGPTSDVSGTVTTRARVSAGNGWNHSLTLAGPETFDGAIVEQYARVNFTALRRVAAAAEKAAGTGFGPLTVEVISDVDVAGSVAGQPVDTTYQPTLSFSVDSVQALPVGESKLAAGGEAVTASEAVSTSTTAMKPATVTVAGWALPVMVLRALALALAAVALGLTAAALRQRRHRRHAQNMVFGDRVLPVSHADIEKHPLIDVTDAASLNNLATRHDLPVLHLTGSTDKFLVMHDNTVYRYTEPNPSPATQPHQPTVPAQPQPKPQVGSWGRSTSR